MYPRLAAFLTLAISSTLSLTATAQIIPDRTLGSENSVVIPNQNIRGIPSDRIDGGAVRGSNLFHSFQEFNINEGRGAYFSNPDNIINILTRVTGGNISEILGTLGVLGNANLFLMNPNGIVFGPHARLDVGGSFFASTADGILFENGVEFAASNPEAPPLLTINIPLGLNIRENPGSIEIQGSGHNYLKDPTTELVIRDNRPLGLQVPLGQTLAFVGGNLFIEGGNLSVEDGRIELASVAQSGLVHLISNPPGWKLNYDSVPTFGDIQLSQAASIDVRGNQGGTVQIQGRHIQLTDASRIETRSLGIGGQAELIVNASETIEVSDVNADQVPSALLSIAEGVGPGGNTTIQTPQLIIRNGAEVGAASIGSGNAGNVNVIASEQVELTGISSDGNSATLASATLLETSGDAGNVHIETRQLTVRDGATLATATVGNGNAGNVTVIASESVVLEGIGINGELSGLFTGTVQGATGNAGNVRLETGTLTLRDGAFIATTTQGFGNAGDIMIIAGERVELTGISPTGDSSGLGASSLGIEGDAGNVRIDTQQLTLRDGAVVGTVTAGNGNAGDVTVIASESVVLEGISTNGALSNLTTGTAQGATGNAGNVRLETGTLTLRDGASIETVTRGEGNAGNITILASDLVELKGDFNGNPSGLGASSLGNSGNAGSVHVQTQTLIVQDGAIIGTITQGSGNAGNLTVIASEFVNLSGVSSSGNLGGLVAGTQGVGEAGNVRIETGWLRVLDGAVVVTGTQSDGNGGNITVMASEAVELDGVSPNELTVSTLAASALGGTGNAGNITIETQQLTLRDGARIRAATQSFGDAGDLNIIASQGVEIEGVSPSGRNVSGLFAETSIGTDTQNDFSPPFDLIGGHAGNINIETQTLTMRNGGQILTGSVFSQGNAGNIEIVASESIELSNELNRQFNDISTLSFLGRGNAGAIRLQTQQLTLGNNTSINAASLLSVEQAQAGSISINADSLKILGEGDITAGTFAAGDAGNITLNLGELSLENQGSITVRSRSQELDELSNFNEAQLLELAEVFTFLLNRSEQPIGNPGNINIQAGEIVLNNQASLNAASENGSGGNITIEASEILLRRQSEIVATGSASGETLEGNIDIGTNLLILLENSQIVTDAFNPRGGSNIRISPQEGEKLAVLQSQNSIINAAGELSIDETLNFDPPEVSTVVVIDPTELIAQDPCIQGRDSSFIITGRGGLVPDPTEELTIIEGLVEWESFLVEPVTPQSNNSSTRPQQRTRNRDNNRENNPVDSRTIVPARGWIRNSDGEVILVGYDPTKTGVQRQPQSSYNQCHFPE
ncbi:MAG: filamentous hemagglutinin N-terminal domain-containing protein [Cyanobacteria bacterium J06592_8]